MLKLMKDFIKDEDGLELVEWAIVAALITAAAATAVTNIGGSVQSSLQALFSRFPAP